jgi:hypothetical protein
MGFSLVDFFKNLATSSTGFNFGEDEKEFETVDGEEVEISLSPIRGFNSGDYYPPVEDRDRIDRYRRNKKLFKGQNFEVFKNFDGSKKKQDLLYVSVNLAGIICKKSADFLFGESVQVKAGSGDSSPEQDAFNRFTEQNDMSILNYESALSNAYRGDSFIKVRYGQEYGGELSKQLDPARVIIEPIDPMHVFPETSLYNKNKIVAYHVAVPVLVDVDEQEVWQLFIESHYAGRIEYRVFNLEALETNYLGSYYEVINWKIGEEILEGREVVQTGVPMPLVVHIPNFATDDSWEGIDDITEHVAILDEINNRLTQIADILDKHSDPAIAIPSGILGEDGEGNPTFQVSQDKVFEVMGKDDVIPQYITWDGQLQQAFTELEKLVDMLLTTAEIPAVALGKSDGGGTSGTSGLAIKWRMNNLLAKINRKRQYYNRGLKKVYMIAQLLEQAVGVADYEPAMPVLTFQDGLPKDDNQEATVMNIRTGGAKTLSQKTAIMRMEGMTPEQAEAEIKQIQEEAQSNMEAVQGPTDASNAPEDKSTPKDPKASTEDDSGSKTAQDKTDTSKHAEGNPQTPDSVKAEAKTGTKKE